MKRRVRRLVQPLYDPIVNRVQGRIDTAVRRAELRLDEVESPMHELVPDVAAMKQYLPIVLNVIASQNAAEREGRRALLDAQERFDAFAQDVDRRIGELWARTEFTRKELMFEMRYGGRGPASNSETLEPQVIDAAKLAAANGNVRLNLGCGHLPLDGYVNVDSRGLPGVDLVADVRRLPFGAGEVAEVFSAHMLEHFPVEQLTRILLPYWYSLLRPGGRIVAVVPDGETMLSEYAAGGVTFAELREVTFGGQEYDGDYHFTMFSRDSLSELLEHAGFVDVTVRESGRRNGMCYEMEIAATKSSTAQA